MENILLIKLVQDIKSALDSVRNLTELSRTEIGDKEFSDLFCGRITREIAKSNRMLKDFLDHIKETTSYNWFYAFSESPFEVTPDPKFSYFTSSYHHALTSVLDGIRDRAGIISVTGEAGTGKTTLIRLLLNRLDKRAKTAFIFHTTNTFTELLKSILLELELEVVEEQEKTLPSQLREYLDRLAINETVAIIIDEAQNLQEGVIEELGGLSDNDGRVQIIFVGQPEFEGKLRSQRLRQTNQKIMIKRQIMALNKEQSEKYINHRLQRVGSKSIKILTPGAISMIASYSQGIPRTINIVCDNALRTGYSLSRKKVDEEIILKVIRNMEGPKRDFPSKIITAIKGYRLKAIGLNLFSPPSD